MESFGGQMVTMGKSRSTIGWVVIEVATGFFCQSLYDLPIKYPAPMNPRQTIQNHTNFAVLLYKINVKLEGKIDITLAVDM